MSSLQILALALIPAPVLWLEKRVRAVRTLGAVLVCYAVGIALANTPGLHLVRQASLDLCGVAIALAIPLLLLSLDVMRWLRFARPTLLSFGLILLSVVIMSGLAFALLGSRIAHGADVAGMLVGVYTGGTPNMAAIGTALGVPGETFVMLNAADILTAAIYLPYLLALAPRQWARLLPPTPRIAPDAETTASTSPKIGQRVNQAWRGLLLAIAALGASWLLSHALPGLPQETVVLLGVTSLAIALSFVPAVRRLEASQDLGQYLLLVFCVAIGSTSDFSQVQASSLVLLGFVALVMFGSVLLHLLLATLLRIDRDTVIVTSTAAIFGPAFVGPVVLAVDNREMMISGVATGLVGFAVGNYLGLGMAWLLS
ncbi:MAG: DUF819 family protein [Pseudomonadota bacterium]